LAQCEAKIPELFEEVMADLKKSDAMDQVKSAFVKIRFSDFSRTTVERAGIELSLESYLDLLREGLGRKSLNVRLLGVGVRFHEPDTEREVQLELKM
jgi:DNA polymerase IV